MTYLTQTYSWIAAHPAASVQYLLLAWGLANILWAQWPKPHSPTGIAIWKFLNRALLLVSTHSTAQGTFTWPSLIRAVLAGLLNKPVADPFEPSCPTPAVPPQPTAPVAGDNHGSSSA